MTRRQLTVKAKMVQRRQEIIKELWPNHDPAYVWDRLKSDGYTTIPRCMPYILDILNQLSSGNPLASTYLTLWCHSYDEGLVEIKSEQEIAFESGFKGQRAISTWRDKMKKVKECGFIATEKGKFGAYNYVLLYNPFYVIKQHYKSGSGLISKESYLALVERAQIIGAKDLNKDINLPKMATGE